ncbi:hypothetical protein JRQ81_001468 [Phrynocephalus forsythii]|uniref:Uncharacterized protein n=1 Tax=Phrynocephalus forsythii TaxID=171643 RepID=A0A9Q0Y804_9SAUR|nr:hypothetical protein JRQ81_001468 [Phrynocephalus forsythii]
MVWWESSAPSRQCSGGSGSWTLSDGFGWWLLPPMLLFLLARPLKLAAFPTSLSDCQTPTGWNCSGYDDRENDLFLCDTNTCKFDGECLRIGDTVTCVCQFKRSQSENLAAKSKELAGQPTGVKKTEASLGKM